MAKFDTYPPALQNRLTFAARQCVHAAMLDSLIDKGLLSDYLEGKDSTKEAEQAFYTQLRETEGAVLWQKCQPLRELLRVIEKNYWDADAEFRSRLAMEDMGELLEVTPDMGDTHNFGRTTCVFRTDRGKYVYKPHDMRIDAAIGDFFDRFFPDTVRLPKVIVREGYGFAEFMENRPAATMEDARAYYRRMGAFAVALKILDGTDMHVENLLAMGAYPVPIDLETIMNPSFTEEDSIFSDITLSCLLPCKLGEMQISPLFSAEDDNVSAPVVGGKRVTARECMDDFLEGFEAAYRSVMARREELTAYISGLPVFTVRLILRGTQAYTVLYRKTTSRAWLNDATLSENVLETLRHTTRPIPEKVLRAETAAILRGDIPYFCAESDSKRILGEEGLITCSCIDNALRQARSLSERDMRLQMAMFRDLARPPKCREASKDPVDRAEALFEGLLGNAVKTPDGSLRWIEDTGKNVQITDDGFMGGISGIALFASALYRVTGRQDARALRDRLLRQISADVPRIRDASWGKGLSGIAHACLLMPDAPLAGEILEKIIGILPDMDISGLGADVVAGLAGVLIGVCEIGDARLAMFKQAVAQKLIGMREGCWKTVHAKRFISGFGHGQAGIGYALWLAGYPEEAEYAFEFERKCYDDKLGTWPDFRTREDPVDAMYGICAGAPGNGLVALRTDDMGELACAIESCLRQDILPRNHLCCGNSSAIEFLLEAGQALGRPELIAFARDRMRGLEGIWVANSASLFQGVAGVGYTLLRCADAVLIPSSVLL